MTNKSRKKVDYRKLQYNNNNNNTAILSNQNNSIPNVSSLSIFLFCFLRIEFIPITKNKTKHIYNSHRLMDSPAFVGMTDLECLAHTVVNSNKKLCSRNKK